MVWKLNHPPRALTIAGSDSGGGAGIQADLKTFLVHGVHGMSAITSITAQNTKEVTGILDIPPEFVVKQIEAVVEDIGVDAAKTGMLSNREIIRALGSFLRKYDFPLVVDPVMVAKSGARLLKEEAIEALKREIIPRADVVTPNKMEAEVLSGITISNLEDAKKAAQVIQKEYSPKAVVIKGGHFEFSKVTDVVLYNGEFYMIPGNWIEDGCTHGTGCSFSAAITANLAWGYDILTSIKMAKEFITHSILYGTKVGKGHCPVNPASWLEIPAEKHRILVELAEAAKILTEHSNEELIELYPEVGINLVKSLPAWYAKDAKDVAGFPGRIVLAGGKLVSPFPPAFGASKHMAKAVLTMMKFDSSKRAGMNILYIEGLERAAEKVGLKTSYFDRAEEPQEVRDTEGATTPWGIETAVKRAGVIPDIVIDKGGFGKEPLAFVFGTSPIEVVKKVIEISRLLHM
ncbi:MAG: bifunctional hydroxymethylpyrimidine kinase/phosphomethylpyrimidine kinase [Fervidicoccaceae archaeon]|jgi:hydroxymethylpyrimidine/phosphomethylpyrimidine kinase